MVFAVPYPYSLVGAMYPDYALDPDVYIVCILIWLG
jgi:hypothetical protein